LVEANKMPFELTFQMYQERFCYPVQCSSFLYRKEVFSIVGLFDHRWSVGEDFDFQLRLLQVQAVPIISAACFDRRIHESNVSIESGPSNRLIFKETVLRELEHLFHHHGIPFVDIDPWENAFLG